MQKPMKCRMKNVKSGKNGQKERSNQVYGKLLWKFVDLFSSIQFIVRSDVWMVYTHIQPIPNPSQYFSIVICYRHLFIIRQKFIEEALYVFVCVCVYVCVCGRLLSNEFAKKSNRCKTWSLCHHIDFFLSIFVELLLLHRFELN